MDLLGNLGEHAPPAESRDDQPYEVVALKYRPQNFEQLVGQEHVWKGLKGAILAKRIGHAYLFTGARGVGKTTTARILAKCLNCHRSDQPTITPCVAGSAEECDSCRGISDGGQDIDVIEMDAASNRGIDDVRDLREKVSIRPTRSRYKIYILDEAHMLTREAFNALLKTLEEPPPHVKFIFCTTEAEKLPITIRSRCQRFDFAHVQEDKILARLAEIVSHEKVDGQPVTVEPEALTLLARRAAGSMRDSQSLLEQLLALNKTELSVNDVHEMLGTTDNSRLTRILRQLADQDAAGALAEFDAAVRDGGEVGQIMEQLFGCLRDVMVMSVGAEADVLLQHTSGQAAELRDLGHRIGLETILAMMQIIDQTLARFKNLPQPRILAELSLVRMSRLANLQAVSQVVAALQSGQLPQLTLKLPTPQTPVPAESPATPEPSKKKELTADNAVFTADLSGNPPPGPLSVSVESVPIPAALAPANSTPSTADTLRVLPVTRGVTEAVEEAVTVAQIESAWQKVLEEKESLIVDHARQAKYCATLAPNQLVLTFGKKYNFEQCERNRNTAQLESFLQEYLGCKVSLVLKLDTAGSSPAGPPPVKATTVAKVDQAAILEQDFVKKAVELFQGRIMHVEGPMVLDNA
ncbi:MAG: DNA polymerase III subunit gamma/tau [Pirellulales bacterium]|nr:DNA polymerase III subunit gamma/tau [Pirellulales bacterium]